MFTYATRRRRRRWRRRRRLAVLLAVITVAAVAKQLVARPHPAGPSQTATAPAASRAVQHAHRAASPPKAPKPSTEPSITWTDFHGIQLPVSAEAGPHYRHRGLAGGFTDTPLGAVLAAVNIAVRTAAQWGQPIYRPTINHQVTGEPMLTQGQGLAPCPRLRAGIPRPVSARTLAERCQYLTGDPLGAGQCHLCPPYPGDI